MRIQAASLLFPLSFCAAFPSHAQVYFYPPNTNEHHTPQAVNPVEANVLLAHHLGFPIYESLEDGASFDSWNNLLKSVGSPKIGVENQTAMMMVIQSDHPEDFVPPSMKPAFTITSPPPAETFTDLIHAYTERANQLFDTVFSSLIEKVAHSATYKSLLDIFDLSSEAAQLFVEEFNAVVGYIEAEEASGPSGEKFAAFEVKGLAQVEEQLGRDEYLIAAKSVQALLSNPFLQSQTVAIIIAPRTVPPQSHSYSRRAVADGPRDLPNHNRAVHSISTCFASNATCAEKTNDCSGRGSCLEITRAGKSCFTCSCSVTKNEKGRKEWWAGQACEKKDLSSPFMLLAGTTIFLILLIGFAISILSSVGYEELPNTLTASASPHAPR